VSCGFVVVEDEGKNIENNNQMHVPFPWQRKARNFQIKAVFSIAIKTKNKRKEHVSD